MEENEPVDDSKDGRLQPRDPGADLSLQVNRAELRRSRIGFVRRRESLKDGAQGSRLVTRGGSEQRVLEAAAGCPAWARGADGDIAGIQPEPIVAGIAEVAEVSAADANPVVDEARDIAARETVRCVAHRSGLGHSICRLSGTRWERSTLPSRWRRPTTMPGAIPCSRANARTADSLTSLRTRKAA